MRTSPGRKQERRIANASYGDAIDRHIGIVDADAEEIIAWDNRAASAGSVHGQILNRHRAGRDCHDRLPRNTRVHKAVRQTEDRRGLDDRAGFALAE